MKGSHGKWLLGCAAMLAILALTSLAATAASLHLSSAAIHSGAEIPTAFTCSGADKSPPLAWSGVPRGTRALALILEDPDAPGGTFFHWVIYDIPADSSGLPEAVANRPALQSGAKQGINSFDHVGYGGPCPPPGPPHHYRFRLFALDRAVHPGAKATAAELKQAMRGHIKASAEMVAVFGR